MQSKALILLAGLSISVAYAAGPISLTVSDFGQNREESQLDWNSEIKAIQEVMGAPVKFSIAPSTALTGDIIYVSKVNESVYQQKGYVVLGQAMRLGVDGKLTNQISDMFIFRKAGVKITNLKDLQGKTVGIVGNGDETSGKMLKDALSAQGITAHFVSFRNYEEALKALKADKVVGAPAMRYAAQKIMNDSPGSFAVISVGVHEAGYLMAKGISHDKMVALKAMLATAHESARGYHGDVQYYA